MEVGDSKLMWEVRRDAVTLLWAWDIWDRHGAIERGTRHNTEAKALAVCRATVMGLARERARAWLKVAAGIRAEVVRV